MTPNPLPSSPTPGRRTTLLCVVMAGLVSLVLTAGAQAAQPPSVAMAPAVSKENAANDAPVPQPVFHGVSWIGQQPSGNYTLQLMAAASGGPLHGYARKKSLAGPLAVAGFMSGDRVLYLLLQGSYPSHGEAQSAAAQLEQEGAERPWVRRFSSLPALFDGNAVAQHKTLGKQPPPAAGAAWLWSRNPLRYTLQLMGDRHVDGLRRLAATQRFEGPLAIVRVVRKGKPWYLLLAGDYAGEAEALAAIGTLPEALRGARPWPRHFAALQEQLVAANH